MRAFIFQVWVHAGKTYALTLAALETLASNQFDTAEQGGRVIVSSTVQGQSFTWEIPEGQTPADFSQIVYESWSFIQKGGTSGAAMTDAQLEAYLVDAGNEVTDRTVGVFAQQIR
tara:strand:+ start:3714 stop:4058 length:345 start_codon:yes stop_codon:yes gene_type:complete